MTTEQLFKGVALPDLTTPLFVTAAFVGISWLIAYAGGDQTDAIGHTLTVFALAFGLLVLGGTMGKLRTMLGAGCIAHRMEARAQIEPPPRGVGAR
jgi:hypothetical protein